METRTWLQGRLLLIKTSLISLWAIHWMSLNEFTLLRCCKKKEQMLLWFKFENFGGKKIKWKSKTATKWIFPHTIFWYNKSISDSCAAEGNFLFILIQICVLLTVKRRRKQGGLNGILVYNFKNDGKFNAVSLV